MKGKRKKIWIGALSTLAMASLSVATVALTGVNAKAEMVEISKDESKWQSVVGMTVDSSYGLVPNVLASNKSLMSATSVEYEANQSGKITSNLTGGSYGVMAYYLQWNEGTDAVSWDWQAAALTDGATNEFTTHNNGSEKIVATGVRGDWVAVIISYAKAPMVLECTNGTITNVCDLWTSGFGTPDYQSYFNQETQLSYSISETGTGITYQMTYYTPNNGVQTQVPMTATGGVRTVSNAKLKGDGSVRIEKIVAGAEFTTGNANYNAGTGAPVSSFKVEVDGTIASDDSGDYTPTNMLVDGDFSSGNWSTNWNAGWTSNGARTIENGALKITNDTETSQYVAQLVSLTAGKTYKLSADIKLENIGAAEGKGGEGAWFAALTPAKATVKKAGYEGITTETAATKNNWETFTFEFTAEETGDYRIAFYLYGVTGSLWVDNVELLNLSGDDDSTAVEFGTDANKWAVLDKISVSENGLVPSAPFFTAQSVEVGGNSSMEIVTDFAEGDLWGCTVYFFKWNDELDSVNWVYASEAALPFNGSSGSGMTAASATGNWIALVVNTVAAPAVYECCDGVISYKGNLWMEGFNGYDYWYIYNQKTSVKFFTTDMASGTSVSITYDAIDAGVGASTFSYSSTNTQLRGEGAFVINHLIGTAPFTNTNNSISVIVDDIDSEYSAGVDEEKAKHWATDVSYPLDFTDGSFTLVGIGDPQNFAKRVDPSGSYYRQLFKWIADNKNTYNMQYAINLGDIVDQCPDEGEWQIAAEAHKYLQDAGLKYALTMGNHDYDGYWNLFKGQNMDRTATSFEKYFPYSTYASWLGNENFGVFDEGKMQNSWHKFTNGNDKYLIVTLEYGVTAEMVAKAKALIDANPDYHVIISTHSYLNGDLSYNYNGYTDLGHDGAITPVELFDTLISKCPNIFMVLCGHTVSYGVSTTVVYGDAGNPIIQMKLDPQGTFDDKESLIALFKVKGTSVETYYYSVSSGRYYAGSNFSVAPVQGTAGANGGVVKVGLGEKLNVSTLLNLTAKDGVEHDVYGTPTSSDTSVATIDANGNIVVKKAGTTTINYVLSGRNSAYATNGVLTGYTVTLEVVCEHADTDKNHICDTCGVQISNCTDGNNDHVCEICGKRATDCKDDNKDHNCDICGVKLSDCKDENSDHKCDTCGTQISNCTDGNNDHNCDSCGEKVSDCNDTNFDHNCDTCGVQISNCTDGNNDHVCEICGKRATDCKNENNDHSCDICGLKLSDCVDDNKDNYCDICGELTHICADTDNDHNCNTCGALLSPCEDTDKNHICDTCGKQISNCADTDGDHYCNTCGSKATDCKDENNDHNCDICGEKVSDCKDADSNHKCDTCGVKVSDCKDETKDHNCDICGTKLTACEDADNNHMCDTCGKQISNCADTNNDHNCDICGARATDCKDENSDHTCEICGEKVSNCVDENKDNYCDICGELTHVCADADNNHMCDTCGKQISNCADNNNDHNCDICGARATDCKDDNKDHNCDICGTKLTPCEDKNSDHKCDMCGVKVSDCKDDNKDHSCDVCGNKVSDCKDSDKDHKCDTCGNKLSDCKDENKDHACDICGKELSKCEDKNNDHLCDVCEDKISDCKDETKDHLCDICGEKASDCEDTDNDHNCDICGKELSVCKDENTDHKCDICGTAQGKHEGTATSHICSYCGKTASDCEDKDTNHKCDICETAMGTHEAAQGSHNCGYCGEKMSDCGDSDEDHNCDICGKELTTCKDENNDHYCDVCGKELTTCKDENSDHKCDTCNEKLSDCKDDNKDHNCDVCNDKLSVCKDENEDHNCDICGVKVSDCEDKNNDHNCDVCGEKESDCKDDSKDHKCDTCGKKLSDCKDDDTNHACDICSGAMGTHEAAQGSHNCEYCGEKASDCEDKDTNHKCDICETAMGTHEAAQGSHECEYCGEKVSDCVDENKNHACDICSATVGVHEAAQGSHNCAHCGKAVSDCEDKDTDHACDICGGEVGLHIAATGTHTCVYCGEAVSACEDTDNNHKCDICDENVGTHEGAQGSHTCEYCGEKASDCTDENADGACDICGETVTVETPDTGDNDNTGNTDGETSNGGNEEKAGCSASVSGLAVVGVALAACVVARKRKED